ncbi:hypothetical protein MNBD_GAMMA22-612 [hydrothermal vent metagenome]|uniref:Uncharacterized protein n=1 Tax=hydrothermal vent metagenome TaxID=652676 RepID=A0A3B0ZV28_9ZZZZ
MILNNMKNKLAFKFLLITIIGLFLVSCNNNVNSGTKNSTKVTKIIFVEEEKGIDPYNVRLIVSSDYLRFDDGDSSSGYILYNRKNKIIYNVNDDDKTIMEIHPKRKSVTSPIELNNKDIKVAVLNDAPKIANSTPIKYDLFTNDSLCLAVVSVTNLLPMATKALHEFQQALADDSTYTLDNIPPDMHDACALSMNTFFATRHLNYGFPIQAWTPKGFSRSLISFDEDFKDSEKLFTLPVQYKSFTVDALRAGTVQ